MIEILLVRHGLAGKPDPETHPDDDLRPLTAKGEKAFAKAVKGLRGQAPAPGLILTSPVLRARQTADLLSDGLRLKAKCIRLIPELHHAVHPAKALERLSRMRLPRCLALVGHEPWLGEFLSILISGNPKGSRFKLDKGGACLVSAGSLGKGKGKGKGRKAPKAELVWLMTQEQLQSLA